MDRYEPGELFVYVNGDRWELGQVKRENNKGDGYFCWYSMGDTCANTPTGCMHKLANAGFSHVERTCHVEHMPKNKELRMAPWIECSECGGELPVLITANYCPNCGARVVE